MDAGPRPRSFSGLLWRRPISRQVHLPSKPPRVANGFTRAHRSQQAAARKGKFGSGRERDTGGRDNFKLKTKNQKKKGEVKTKNPREPDEGCTRRLGAPPPSLIRSPVRVSLRPGRSWCGYLSRFL